MSTRQARAARARWAGTTRADRIAATRPAIVASVERRKLAHETLLAVEAAGITVDALRAVVPADKPVA